MSQAGYILGQSTHAELRLQILNELTTERFVEAIGKHKTSHLRVVNLGCGSGHLEERLARVFTHSHFVGIDFSLQRLHEAKLRTLTLDGSNRYEFLEADLMTAPVEDIGRCDILIARFVLSHMSSPLACLQRFLPLVKEGGLVCCEELTSAGTEYYCFGRDHGYNAFCQIANMQQAKQKSSFLTGFLLLNKLSQAPFKVLYREMSQAILDSPRSKSILRLGIADAKETLLTALGQEKLSEIMHALQQFEDDEKSFGLYTRTLSVIAQKMVNENGQ